MSEALPVSYDKLTLTKLFYQKSIRNREKLLNSIPTLIPFISFPRLSNFIPGIVHGENVLCTANTGVGKSRFVRKIFIKDVMQYASQSGLKVKIFLNSLEESSEKVNATLVASELYNLYGLSNVNYYKLTNTSLTPNTEDLQNKIGQACLEVDKKYGNILEVIHDNDPMRIYYRVRDYLRNVGTFYVATFNKGEVVDKKIAEKGDKWNYYEYDDPHIIILISDTIDKYQPTYWFTDEGRILLDKYNSIRNFSEIICRQRLNLVCDVVTVQVSQQSEENLKANTDYKGEKDVWKLKPNLGNLLSVKSIGQDATIALGLFNPSEHHLFNYKGYPDISQMKDNLKYRSLIIMKTREGELSPPDNEVPIACYFSRDEFQELPKPDDPAVWNYFQKTSVFNTNKLG